MRYAVVSDIHANWHALEAVLADLEREQVDELWCLGDIVGYGPRPNRCVKEIRERAAVCLTGNHDLAALGRVGLADFSPDAATSATWTAGELDDDARAFLASLEPRAARDGVELFHGSPRDPVWEYVLTEEAARAALSLAAGPLLLVGHSHLPIALGLSADGALAGGLAPGGSEVGIAEGRWLLNPGSVGQPRDGDPRAAYLIVDRETASAHFRRVPYPIAQTQAEIRARGLPELLAARLAVGE